MKTRRFSHLNEGFQCRNCSVQVPEHGHGSCRNHCNHCLFSCHVDQFPGDRLALCGGLMEPVFVDVRGSSSTIFFRCLLCGYSNKNKSSPDDNLETILKILGRNQPIPES